jgi:hypothetical protein
MTVRENLNAPGDSNSRRRLIGGTRIDDNKGVFGMHNKMVINIVLVFVLAVFFMIGGISSAGQNPEDKTTIKEVRQEVKEAVEAIGNYSAEQRDEALKKVKLAIEDLDDRIDDLEERIEKKWDRMDQVAREKARATLKSLRKKRNKLAEWYGGMQHSSAKAWEHVKKGFLDSYEALSAAYDKAAKEF